MLQQNTPYIKVFKLVTGEEIVAEVFTDIAGSLGIKAPLTLVPTQTGAQFAPFMMMAKGGDDYIMLSKTQIVASSIPSDGIEASYKQVTTGIAVPAKQSIIH